MNIKALWNWKTKLSLLITVLLILFIGFMKMERDNGKTTWSNLWECFGKGRNVRQESDYDFIFNKCAIIYKDENGNEYKRVHANLDVNTQLPDKTEE